MSINPFTFGNPIHEPGRFIGRTEELRQIVNRLRSSAHESTSIVGERRMGKTSLLKHLETKQVMESYGLPADAYCMVYMDFQGLTDITPARFWQRVLQKLERAICKPDLASDIRQLRERDTFDLFDLEDLFSLILSENLTPVLLMDEFEYVTQNANFGPDFFGGLRALAIHQNLPLITATRRELVDLCHSDEIKGSPFFNIFANIVLRPFSQQDVAQLLDTYLAGTAITFNASESALLMQLSGGYPFFTQMAGHYLFDARSRGLRGDPLVQQVLSDFDAQVEPHFNYLWTHTTECEKITLLGVISLSRQKPGPKSSPNLPNLASINQHAHLDLPELVKRGLLLEDKSKATYALLSDSLERWILREILVPSGEEETKDAVDSWLDAGGRDSLVPAAGFLPRFKKKYWPILQGFAKDISMELIGNLAFELLSKGVI